ncbi:hypothetical protein F5Y16DRAFT_331907 [Xylariaceae sp. FL0255]|nr:hypothetical protein F5Y16DRAFT_331907 [Xylariaceae sp. FL0255]
MRVVFNERKALWAATAPPSTDNHSDAPLQAGVDLQATSGEGIQCASTNDAPAIVDIQIRSFPEVYNEYDIVMHRLAHDLEANPDFCKIFTIGSTDRGRHVVHGAVILESYLWSARESQNPVTGEAIELSVNRPAERNSAENLLMAATRVDPGLLKEEFLFVPELCVHPHMRGRGLGQKLMRHVLNLANHVGLNIVVIAEDSVIEAAQRWIEEEGGGEDVDPDDLDALARVEEWPATTQFYERKLSFHRRSHFFWGRQDSAIPRMFHVLQHRQCRCCRPPTVTDRSW